MEEPFKGGFEKVAFSGLITAGARFGMKAGSQILKGAKSVGTKLLTKADPKTKQKVFSPGKALAVAFGGAEAVDVAQRTRSAQRNMSRF